jgi:hypothetical protein
MSNTPLKMARSNTKQSMEVPDAPGPIEVNGIIYAPTSTVRSNREQRSRLLKYNDADLKELREFKYKKFGSMRRRIRLLRLFPGGQNNPEVTCKLFEVEFDENNIVRDIDDEDDKPSHEKAKFDENSIVRDVDDQNGKPSHDKAVVKYEALSWCWGQESRDWGLRVVLKDGPRRMAITRELLLALKYLRSRTVDRVLWIDALCINQADHEERNHQVQMMSRIYNGAEQVCVWLGEDNDDSTMAFSFIHEIMQLENFDSISEKSENAKKWQSLLLLMQRPWFSRRWVVQEIALARAATIYCGNDNIPWQQFAVAVELFVEVETATHRLSEPIEVYGFPLTGTTTGSIFVLEIRMEFDTVGLYRHLPYYLGFWCASVARTRNAQDARPL